MNSSRRRKPRPFAVVLASMPEKESRPGENTEATNPMTDHHHTTGSPNSNGSGYDADKALADLFLYLDVCCGGESTSGWLHVSCGL